MRMKETLLVGFVASVCITSGCKRDEPSGGGPPATTSAQPSAASTIRENLKEGTVRAGIYELISLTETTTSCDGEGASILDKEASRFLVTRQTGGLVELHACKSVDDCRDHLAQLSAGKPACDRVPMMLTKQDASGNAYGTTTQTGIPRGEECKGAELKETRLVKEATDAIRIEESTRKGSFPAKDGRCTTFAAGEAMASAPCSSRRVTRAKLALAL